MQQACGDPHDGGQARPALLLRNDRPTNRVQARAISDGVLHRLIVRSQPRLFFLGGGLFSFGSKTQSLTAQSTVESELQALSYEARNAVYLSNFLMGLGFKTFSSVPINSDSTGALSVAGNAMFSSRTNRIALRFFFVRELIKRNTTTLHRKPTQQMLADIATHLSKQRFRELLQQIKKFTC